MKNIKDLGKDVGITACLLGVLLLVAWIIQLCIKIFIMALKMSFLIILKDVFLTVLILFIFGIVYNFTRRR